MEDFDLPMPQQFRGAVDEFNTLDPLYSNFVGVHIYPEEVMLAFCIRETNPVDMGGEVVGIRPHTRIFMPPTTARRLYLALKSTYGD